MNKFIVYLLFVFFVISLIRAPPVTELHHETQSIDLNDTVMGLEYERYLKEVVNVLEKDPIFRQKISEANQSEITNGDIARHLKFVDKGVRTKLDELKRKEIERLKEVIRIKDKLKLGIDIERIISHIDHEDMDNFGDHDLKKLIVQATKDLDELDRRRKEEFKTYEMEKEHERREELKKMDDAHRIAAEQQYKEREEKKKKHPKINHPGNEAQLKEVWEETDGLEDEDFKPKTFFVLHDTNGDGYWDEDELEALFQIELDKLYNTSDPNVDMMERYEEMNRMREHVMKEIDVNKDKMVSLEEFMENTKNRDYKEDEEWKTIEDEEPYTDEEFKEFERSYQEINRENEPVVDVVKMNQQPHVKSEEEHNVVKGEVPLQPHHENPQHQQQPQHRDEKGQPLKFENSRQKHDEGPPKVYETKPPSIVPIHHSQQGDLPVHPRAG